MENFFVKQIVDITNGKLLCGDENTEILDIKSDSRSLNKQDLFVPLIGEKVDAHIYLEDALFNCSAAFTMQHKEATKKMLESGAAVIAVEDTLTAMQRVAEEIRNRYDLPIIGVTGSVGKTTTREMIYTALAAEKRVFQTYKNYNSQVGVPLTMAKLDKTYELAVLEMGISEFGEMSRLAAMIRPNTAVVTCIGAAHIEKLKTKENTCREKLCIADYMTENDIIYLNGDDDVLRAYEKELNHKIVWYGMSDFCDYRAENIHMEKDVQAFDMITPNGRYNAEMIALGEHNVRNALVAVAVANQYGIKEEDALKALRSFKGQRQQVIETSYFTIIDSTYNASPDSMQANLKVLKSMPCKGRRIAVLADMLELGENGKEYHSKIGEYVKECNIDYLIGYGQLSKEIIDAAGIESFHASSLDEVVEHLQMMAAPKDLVLFMGSNGMKLKDAMKEFL